MGLINTPIQFLLVPAQLFTGFTWEPGFICMNFLSPTFEGFLGLQCAQSLEQGQPGHPRVPEQSTVPHHQRERCAPSAAVCSLKAYMDIWDEAEPSCIPHCPTALKIQFWR